MSFFGRSELLKQLGDLWQKRTSSFVTCRGRRRIGKSTLIGRFAGESGARFLAFEGLPPRPRMTNADQLAAFGRQLGEQTGLPPFKPDSWFDAFRFLEGALTGGEKTVVLLDEISWMGRYDPNFAGELKSAWDRRFCRRDDLILVACGSVSSWIRDNILASTGFVGRVSLDLVVDELPPSVCPAFWGAAGERLSDRELLDVLSVTGGIPKYLEEVIPSLSAEENIRRMCFSKNGYLFGDFEDIFASVFGANAPLKRRILVRLADGGCTRQRLATELGIAVNGQLSDTMEELRLAGFVGNDAGANPETGRRAKSGVYRLRDNYTRFYLKYVFPRRQEIESGTYRFAALESLPGWNSIAGLQFENLVRNNFAELLPALRLDGVQIESAGPYQRSASASGKGVQVDLLIQTRKAYHVVEIKRQDRIGVEIEDEVGEKIRRLRVPKGMSVRTALVYDGEVSKALRSNGFFDALVPAGALLGRGAGL